MSYNDIHQSVFCHFFIRTHYVLRTGIISIVFTDLVGEVCEAFVQSFIAVLLLAYAVYKQLTYVLNEQFYVCVYPEQTYDFAIGDVVH